MASYLDSDRQIRLIMMHLSEEWPGLVCMDTKCREYEVVPHMANDGGDHPHPYSRRPPFSLTALRKMRLDRKRIHD